jgi:hypothetical protein
MTVTEDRPASILGQRLLRREDPALLTGEAGTIGAAPAVINAVVDALSGLGVTDMPMPASPHNVWKAIQAAANPVNANNPANRGATK